MGNKKITDLPSATAVNAGDKVEIVQGGTSKQVDANLLSGSGLSGLTTNKVLKATSSTTVGNSNITDDGTIVIIESPNALNSIYVSNVISGYGYGSNESGSVDTNDSRTNVTHTIKNTFDAPLHEFNNSIKKNGVEVATVNDIPTVLPRKYFAYNNTTYSYTGTTASTILRTIYIPANSMNLNSTLELHAIFGKSGTAGVMYYAAYITTNPSVITGGSIVKTNSFASNVLQGGFVLRLTNKNSLNSQAVQLPNSGANQYDTWQLTNFARTLLSIDFAVDQYLHIYSTLVNATDTAIIYDYQCYIDKN